MDVTGNIVYLMPPGLPPEENAAGVSSKKLSGRSVKALEAGYSIMAPTDSSLRNDQAVRTNNAKLFYMRYNDISSDAMRASSHMKVATLDWEMNDHITQYNTLKNRLQNKVFGVAANNNNWFRPYVRDAVSLWSPATNIHSELNRLSIP